MWTHHRVIRKGSRQSSAIVSSPIHQTPSESDLAVQAKRGSWPAFAELVRRHQSAVRGCLAVRLEQPHEAEDLAQEAFVTAYRKLDEFDTERPFGPWVRSIAFNLLRNHWRKFRVVGVGGNDELEAMVDQTIAARCDGREGRELSALRDCLETLDGPARALMERRYNDEASVREIAKEQGRGYSAVTMHLHRVRELLANCVRAKLGEASA
jgi:RNA polymerase sigma-70 factor (ECF subfamily)